MRACLEGKYLECDLWALRRLQQVLDLRAHDLRAADLASECGLVHDQPEPQRVFFAQGGLPIHPGYDSPLHLFRGEFREHAPDDGAGVVLSLKQSGNEYRAVRQQRLGFGFRYRVPLRPGATGGKGRTIVTDVILDGFAPGRWHVRSWKTDGFMGPCPLSSGEFSLGPAR